MTDNIEVTHEEESEDEVLDLIFTLKTIAEVMDTGLVDVKVYSSLLTDAADALEQVYEKLVAWENLFKPTTPTYPGGVA